jgi:hypothetical protein
LTYHLRNASRPPFFAEIVKYPRQLIFAQTRDQVGGRLALRGIHPHIQRRVIMV